MFRDLFTGGTGNTASFGSAGQGQQKSMSPHLRGDIYTAIDQCKNWIIGSSTSTNGKPKSEAGDGVSYSSLLTLIQRHFPLTEMALDAIGKADAEIAIIVGGVTNMIMEMTKWEGMAGGMAMRTWCDALTEAHKRVPLSPDGERKEKVAKGITRAITQNVDVGLMPKEFTTRIGVISNLKTREWTSFTLHCHSFLSCSPFSFHSTSTNFSYC
jgi:phenylpyruvate tautomerase PptA (4-oxalocrotonate tautomerase family)